MKTKLIEAAKEYFAAGLVAVPVKISLVPDKKDPTKAKKKPRFGILWKTQPEYLNIKAVIGVINSDATSYYGKGQKKPIPTVYNSLALLTGQRFNLIVLDIDTDQPNGFKTLEKLGVKIPQKIPCVRTQSGGRHYYFAFPQELKELATTKSLGKDYHIDIRGDGGLVFVPPTQIQDTDTFKGGTYEWYEPLRTNLPPMPQKLIDFIIDKNTKKKVVKPLAKAHRNKTFDDTDKYKYVPDAVSFLGGQVNGYDDWYKIGMSLASMGEEGRSYYQQISNNPNYPDNPSQIDSKFNSFLNSCTGTVQIATLFQIAKEHGFQYPSHSPTVNYQTPKSVQHSKKTEEKNEQTYSPQEIYDFASDTEKGDAVLASKLFKDKYIYDHKRLKWLCWIDGCWKADNEAKINIDVSNRLYAIYDQTAKQFFASALTVKDAEKQLLTEKGKFLCKARTKLCTIARMKNILNWMQSYLSCIQDDFNTDLDIINLKNGVMDLKTFKLLPHDSKRLIDKQAPVTYDHKAQCPFWTQFLETTIIHPDQKCEDGSYNPDEKTIWLLQKYAGLCLSGRIKEQKFLYLHGKGANGKSTFIKALEMLLGRNRHGGYTGNAPIELFMCTRNNNHDPHYMAELMGARLVICDEIEGKMILSEANIKSVTSGIEEIHAMRKYERPMTFDFMGKLVLYGNYRPIIKSSSHAIWRRAIFNEWHYNFDSKPEEKLNSTIVLEKLKNELPGILNWALTGLKYYEEEGLELSENIKDTTTSYRDDSDQLARWIDDKCEIGGGKYTTYKSLYNSYRDWIEETDEYKSYRGKTLLIRELLDREDFDFKKRKKGSQGWIISGIRVNTDPLSESLFFDGNDENDEK